VQDKMQWAAFAGCPLRFFCGFARCAGAGFGEKGGEGGKGHAFRTGAIIQAKGRLQTIFL
jgi:hypothetical protein